MFDILYNIWQMIINIFKFIIHVIESLFILIANIPKYVNVLLTILAEIPNLYLSIAIVTITLSIVFLIVGRNN